AQGNAGVVLYQCLARAEQELPDLGEAVGMRKVGRALEEAVALAEPFAELEEPAALQAVVGDVGAEVIERLLGPVAAGEYDLDARRSALSSFVAGGDERAVGVEGDQTDLMHGFAGAGEEDVEDRQGAAEGCGGKVRSHLLGYEEAVAQHGAERSA